MSNMNEWIVKEVNLALVNGSSANAAPSNGCCDRIYLSTLRSCIRLLLFMGLIRLLLRNRQLDQSTGNPEYWATQPFLAGAAVFMRVICFSTFLQLYIVLEATIWYFSRLLWSTIFVMIEWCQIVFLNAFFNVQKCFCTWFYAYLNDAVPLRIVKWLSFNKHFVSMPVSWSAGVDGLTDRRGKCVHGRAQILVKPNPSASRLDRSTVPITCALRCRHGDANGCFLIQ